MASSGSGRQSAAGNKNTKTKRPTPTRKKGRVTKAEIQRQEAIKKEIIIISIMAIAILLFLCNFGIIGAVGDGISKILFGLFGLLAYIVPVLLFVAVAFGISNGGSRFASRKLVAGVVLFLLLGMLLELFGSDMKSLVDLVKTEGVGAVIKSLYLKSGEQRVGGGVLCGGVAFFFFRFLDMVGTILLVLVGAIISLVVLTEKSFLNQVQTGGKRVLETAKVDASRRKKIAEIRRQEEQVRKADLREERMRQQEILLEEGEQMLRMEKKVSGVMLDTSLQKSEAIFKRDDIHEIILTEESDTWMEAQPVLSQNNSETEWEMLHREGEPTPLPQEFHPIVQVYEQEAGDIHTFEMDMDMEVEREPESIVALRTEPLPEPMQTPEPMHMPGPMTERMTESMLEHKLEQRPEPSSLPKPMTAMERAMAGPREYLPPPLTLLNPVEVKKNGDSQRQLKETALRLQQTLQTFGVRVTITEISQGPSVTRYELQPEQGVKVSKIVGLADDIKLNLAATDIRIEAPIPGKAAIGIEVPNKENSAVFLRELLENREFQEYPSKIAFAVGKDIGGKTIVTDIGKMPHMLIAGATGSGKSVCINTLIMSILYKAHPDEVKLIMIDPKVVELSVYNGIPHLMIPVVTDPKKASAALHWGVAEMTDRYQKFADFGVRDLKGYNQKAEGLKASGEKIDILPQIVIIVDELADLMMVCPGEVEESICRLAQLARAAGIHLIIATQRPSVDVITGLIKANMPSRVAFSVSSGVDSRTILDMNGAEKLLGKGDMLFYPQGYTKPARVQGAFVSDKEVADVVDFLKNQAIGNVYDETVAEKIISLGSGTPPGAFSDEKDSYFVEAGRFIIDKDKASIGMLQRVFKIGFNRAARIMDQLQEAGVVGPEEGTKPRKVLLGIEEFETYIEETV